MPSLLALLSPHVLTAPPSLLSLQHVLSKLAKADPDFTLAQRRELLASLLGEHASDDEATATFIERSSAVIAEQVASLRNQYVARQIVDFAAADRAGALQGLLSVLGTLSDSDKRDLVASLGISPP